MHQNQHHLLSAAMLAGLFVVTSGACYVFLTSSAPGGMQPELPSSSPMFTISWATSTPGERDLAPLGSTVPWVTGTPVLPNPYQNESTVPWAIGTASVVTPAPNIADSGLAIIDYIDYNATVEPLVDAQPKEDRTPTRLIIPATRIDTPVEPVGWHVETRNGKSVNVWDAPDHFAAGWLINSAPVGIPGNTVLDGHNNIEGEVFKNLVNVKVGDTITLFTASLARVYRVDQKLILPEAGQPLKVRQANAQYISPTTDERLTLVTCWPPNGNTHRLIIIARPVS